jgi:hypothetical protein
MHTVDQQLEVALRRLLGGVSAHREEKYPVTGTIKFTADRNLYSLADEIAEQLESLTGAGTESPSGAPIPAR